MPSSVHPRQKSGSVSLIERIEIELAKIVGACREPGELSLAVMRGGTCGIGENIQTPVCVWRMDGSRRVTCILTAYVRPNASFVHFYGTNETKIPETPGKENLDEVLAWIREFFDSRQPVEVQAA